MQKLHLVGFTADHQGLIFSSRRGAKSGGFVVPLSEGLLEAIDILRAGGDVGPVAEEEPPPPRPVSSLSVREVQARLRVGRSIAEVARDAGVDIEWVERFAVPVIAEQRRVIDEAHAIHLDKRGRGQSALPLGEAVRRNIATKGVAVTDDEYGDAWRAHQLHDSRWVVAFRYRSRGHDQEARWEFDQAIGALTSVDRLGTTLGFVEPGAERLPAVATRRSPARRRAAAARATRAAAPVRKTTRAAKKAAPKRAAKKATATRTKTRTQTKKKAASSRKTSSRKRTPPASPQIEVAAVLVPGADAGGNGARTGNGHRPAARRRRAG